MSRGISSAAEFAQELELRVDAYLDADAAVKTDLVAVRDLETRLRSFDRPAPFTSPEALWRHRDQRREIEAALTEARAHRDESTVARAEAQSRLLTLLPGLTWVKVGTLAVGKAYTNWGGHSFYPQIQDWPDDPSTLPSLDHTYTGD